MPSLEAPLVLDIMKAIKARWPESWVTKVHGNPYQKKGIPDVLCVLEGHFIALEVKHRKPGESPRHAYDRTSPEQRRQLAAIGVAGGFGTTVLSVEEALHFIKTVTTTEE